MALDPQVQQARELIKQTIIQTLMREQGMSPEEAAAYAQQRLDATMPPEGSPMNPLELPTMEVRGTPPAQAGGAPQPVQAAPSPSGTTPPPSPAQAPEAGSPTSIFDNPDAVDSVLGMGELNRQMAQAEALRDSSGPEGRYVANGKIYVAGNPLEHLSTGLKRYKGHKDTKRIATEQQDAKKALIDLLRGPKPEAELGDEEYQPGAPI